MQPFSGRLYLSTTAEDAPALAREYGLGLEIAEFCTASNMDEGFPACEERLRLSTAGVERFTLHGAFNELCPAAIDPLARALTEKRYRQSAAMAARYGAKKLVIHTGFVPRVYFPEYFIEESVTFWRSFLSGMTEELIVALENVMETSPEIPAEIARRVDDPRLRLCLDAGHANVTCGSPPLSEWIDRFAPWLTHVHIHNNDGREDAHRCLGEGTLDYAAILDRLEQICPDVTYTIENSTAAPSVDWLRRHGYM